MTNSVKHSTPIRAWVVISAALLLSVGMAHAQNTPAEDLFGPAQAADAVRAVSETETTVEEATTVEPAGAPDSSTAPEPVAADAPADSAAADIAIAAEAALEAAAVTVDRATARLETVAAGLLEIETTPLKPASVPDQSDLTRNAAAIVEARTSFVSPSTGGRVVQIYGQSIPTLVCRPGMVCLVELEPGEEVLDTPVLSDAVRWQAEMRRRDTPVSQTYFAFKPSPDAPALANYFILTDRRVYTINLVKDLTVSTPILSFDYPDTREREMAERIEARKQAQAQKVSAARAARAASTKRTGVSTTKGVVPASELDFNYKMGGKAPFKPLRVYTDGRKTYVDLPASYRGDLPVVIGGSSEANRAFNYRTAKGGQQIIIDKVLSQFELKNGRQSIKVRKGS